MREHGVYTIFRRIVVHKAAGHNESLSLEVGVRALLILPDKFLTGVSTWNVRTLYNTRGLAQVVREMRTYRFQILWTSEIRWTESGRLESEGTRADLLYSEGQRHEGSVGILLNKMTSETVKLGTAKRQNNNDKTTIKIL